MRKQRTFIRLMALLLLLPVLLTAACSFAAMAEGEVILEDPALIGDLEDAMADLVMEPVKQTEGEPAPTQEAAAEPSVEPSQEPTAEPSAHPSQEPTAEPSAQPSQEPTVEPSAQPTQEPTAAPAASYEIEMEAPSGWYLNRAVMEITVRDLGGTGWAAVRISVGGKTLIDGPLPSGHVWIDLLENSEVEVIVTDPYGEAHRKSLPVNCIDNTRPTLKASVKGEYLHIEAADAQSGVAAVQVNGTSYTELSGGTLSIHLKQYADAYEQLLVQAVDRVGNVSKAIAVANPFFHDTPATAAPTAAPTAVPTRKPGSSGSSSGSGSGSGSGGSRATPKPTATPLPTVAPTVTTAVLPTLLPVTGTAGMPFTQAGNAFTRDLLYDRYTNKQFIAIETRGGDVFYMVIDYDKPLDEDGEQYETYFLNLVDSRDLLDIVDESLIEPEIVYVTPEPTVPATPQPVSGQEPKDAGTAPLLGLAGLLAVAGGGALAYVRLKKSSKNRKPAYDYALDDEEDEEQSE